ncbi:hypothetical protein T12_2042 [Trichinella patagoniensis]|uniref:FLYWCH-type domain-containing protein n=1 Tax=Trichinella patagoniensis TaxID=990121 RepID=A0A0V1A5A4_9BILA|nr:hypothetical protein T12_2042 [Trichinella patagoniensis]
MADVPDLRLVPNCCGGMSLVYEGRAYKLKRAGKQKYWRCSKNKKGCGGAIWTNLDVIWVTKQNDHIESCPADEHLAYKMEKKTLLKKLSAEETKPISAIYDEEASAEPSTSGCFPLFKRVKSTMYGHRAKQYPIIVRTCKSLSRSRQRKPCASRHILIFAAGSNIRLLAAMRTWSMDGTFKVVPQWYQQLFTIHAFVADIGTYGFIFQALINKAAVLRVNLNPQTIICDSETALIPAIQGYFPNTRVQGCCFHFCQAVHRRALCKNSLINVFSNK